MDKLECCNQTPCAHPGVGPCNKPARKRRVRRLLWEIAFQWKRLRVCLLSLWYLRHWPWSDLSTAEWRFQLDGETARSAFLEGWCRE